MPVRVRDVMTTRLKTVGAKASLSEVERVMLREKVGGLPVVQDGKLVGMISRSDVVKHLQAVESQAQGALSAYDDGSESQAEIEADRRQVSDAVSADRATAEVEDAMTLEVVTVPPDASLAEAAKLMVEHRIHRLPVVADDQLQGQLSTLDLVGLVASGRLVEG